MYASLISAGASQLYDLYKSVTDRPSSKSTDATPSSSSTVKAAGSAGTPIGSTGSSFSSALQKLFVDLQASQSATANTAADPTNTVADDLKSVAKHLKTAASDGHSASSTNANPFQGLASSLLAYAKTQNLTATTSTSVTA